MGPAAGVALLLLGSLSCCALTLSSGAPLEGWVGRGAVAGCGLDQPRGAGSWPTRLNG